MTLACIFGAEMHLSLMWRGGECLKYTVSSSEKSLIFRILIQNSILGEKKKEKKSIDLDSNSGTYLSW